MSFCFLQQRDFRAQPLPDLDRDNLPEKNVKPSTRPEPFQLEVDIRGAIRADDWSSKVADTAVICC